MTPTHPEQLTTCWHFMELTLVAGLAVTGEPKCGAVATHSASRGFFERYGVCAAHAPLYLAVPSRECRPLEAGVAKGAEAGPTCLATCGAVVCGKPAEFMVTPIPGSGPRTTPWPCCAGCRRDLMPGWLKDGMAKRIDGNAPVPSTPTPTPPKPTPREGCPPGDPREGWADGDLKAERDALRAQRTKIDKEIVDLKVSAEKLTLELGRIENTLHRRREWREGR